jgi:tetratricopeptide (TPR) repeat protein
MRLKLLCIFGVATAIMVGAVLVAPKTSIKMDSKGPADLTKDSEMLEAVSRYDAKHDYPNLIQVLKKLRDKYPDDLSYRMALGSAMEKTDDYKGTIEELKKAEELEAKSKDKFPYLHIKYARALAASGKFDEAVAEHKQAIKIDPKNPDVHLFYGMTLVGSIDPIMCNAAVREFTEAQKLGATDFRIPGMLALALVNSGNLEDGLTELRKAGAIPDAPGEPPSWKQQLSGQAAQVEAILKSRPPAPVPPEKRHYDMPKNAAGVIVRVDEKRKLVTLCLRSRHDPDKGAQDGVDDGIIEMPMPKEPSSSK